MAILSVEAWDRLWESLEALSLSLEAIAKAGRVSPPVRSATRSAAQAYFRDARPVLLATRIPASLTNQLDRIMQDLLRAANKKAPTAKDLLKVLALAGNLRTDLEVSINQALGEEALRRAEGADYTKTELKIIDTLNELVPSAALSYSQALADLVQVDRISFRGTALELRETLREVLDHLAPDDIVTQHVGFKYEDKQTTPTMRQKASFILASRRLGKSAIAAPRDAISVIEGSTSSLARSVYTRSALSTHVANTRAEVRQFKMYLDSVLSDLLQLHAPSTSVES